MDFNLVMQQNVDTPIQYIKAGDTVEFPYRHNPNIKLTGTVINVLTYTIIVEITDKLTFQSIPGLEVRQVVRMEQYRLIVEREIALSTSVQIN